MVILGSKKLVSILTIIAGISFLISGIISIAFYIILIFDVINETDKSVIFWYLPLLFLGTILLVSGILYSIVGFKSITGNEAAYKHSRSLLVIVGILITVIILVGLLNNLVLN